VWGSVIVNILRDKDDRFLYFLTTVENITERRQFEKTLEESKAQLDLALQSASMGVWRWDLIQDRRYFDNQVCSLLGIEPTTFTGTEDEFFNVVYPDDREILRTALTRTIEQDVPYELEYRAVWPDGSVHYIATRGRLARSDVSKRPESINGIIWDITNRKEAEAALQESESRFRNTVEMLPEVVFETDLETNVTYVNQSALEVFGYSAADFESRFKSLEMLVKENEDLSAERLIRQLKGEKTGASEYTALRKDGSTFPVLLHMKPTTKGSELVGFHGIMIDITERKRIEDEKRHTERLSAALEMAGTVCHEFNQPLQVINGRIELLSMAYKDNRIQNTLKLIKEQVQRMGVITKKLMGLKRYSSRDYVGGIKITNIDQISDA
jgi:PAS domain S-box-containing protein